MWMPVVRGGRIFIRGGQFVADNAFLFADTLGSREGQGIDMGVTGQVTMRNGALITAVTLGSGSGGDLTVEAGSLEVLGGAQIGSTTFGSGQGGNLLVEADRVLLSGVGDISGESPSGLFTSAQPGSSGDAGDLTVRAGSLEVLGGAQISAGTFGSGQGGNLLVEADRVLLSGFGVDISGKAHASALFGSAASDSSGDAGDLTVRAGSLEVLGGAQISAGTFGSGQGGNLLVEADRVLLSGFGVDISGAFPSGLFAGVAPDSSGDAGDLTVRAGNLEVLGGAVISARTFSTGRGGNLTITATDIVLGDESAISASSIMTGLDTENDPETGRSGSIFITARDTFRLFNGGRVGVETAQANAGDIILNVGTLLHLQDQSSITTSVAGGTGKGGNITLNSVFVVLDEGSSIVANALEAQAGDIFIRIRGGGALFQSPDSLIKASSEFGIDGSVVIDAPDTDIIAGFAGLPANFLDAATVLTQLCAERSGANVSSLVFRKYEVLPDSPYALRVQLPKTAPDGTGWTAAVRDISAWRHPPLALTCLGR
jgi:large exoprotein involved in heme utilization and adhesion